MSAGVLATVLLSALLHAVWSVAIKGSREPLVFNLLQTLPAVPLLLLLAPFFELREVPGPVWGLLAGTAVVHAFYFLWMTRAFETADLTLVYPITRSTPAFVPFVAVPLLGEDLSPAGVLGIATVVVGLWAVHSGGRIHWRHLLAPGSGYAWLTLAATVVYSLLDKEAMARLGAAPWSGPLPRPVAFYFLLTATSALVFLPLGFSRLRGRRLGPVARQEGGRVVGAVAISFAGYSLILAAMQTAPVSYVVAVRQTSVLFAVLLGVWLLRERPNPARALGAVATVVGVALIGLRG